MIVSTLISALIFVVIIACLHPLAKAFIRHQERKRVDTEAWFKAERAEWEARQGTDRA